MNTRKLLRNAVIGSLIILILVTGCGKWRKFKEQDLSYKSLIGRTGRIRLYAAGEIVADYPKAQILYSSSDSGALWLKINEKEIYWQGDAFIELD
jgi:hypothetical protein